MKALVNFDNGHIYCASCANQLNLKENQNQKFVETWNKLDFQYTYCKKCEIEVYEGNIRNGQHLAMFIDCDY